VAAFVLAVVVDFVVGVNSPQPPSALTVLPAKAQVPVLAPGAGVKNWQLPQPSAAAAFAPGLASARPNVARAAVPTTTRVMKTRRLHGGIKVLLKFL
jgi:hypothetical protein